MHRSGPGSYRFRSYHDIDEPFPQRRRYMRTPGAGTVASCRRVTGMDDGFWSRYQDDNARRRHVRHAQGMAYAGSTQNLGVRKQAFVQAGGFDTRYTEYGFEDRDLLVRLSRLGAVAYCAEATVRHFDFLKLPIVLAKMGKAACSSAVLFSRDHPDAYRRLGYATIDARLHPWLQPVCFVLAPLLRCAPAVDRLLAKRWMPYPIARIIVKLLTALAFARGTMAAR